MPLMARGYAFPYHPTLARRQDCGAVSVSATPVAGPVHSVSSPVTFTRQAGMAVGTPKDRREEKPVSWAAAKKRGGGKGDLWCVPGAQVEQQYDVPASLQSMRIVWVVCLSTPQPLMRETAAPTAGDGCGATSCRPFPRALVLTTTLVANCWP